MKKYTVILIAFLITQSLMYGQNVDMHGYARSYIGILTEQDGKYSILQNTFNFELSLSNENSALYINPYIYQYSEKETELALREIYLDFQLGKNFSTRIGKQQIIWGKADGVFITDIISPKNLSEFLLPDFEEIRIGVTSMKMNYYIGNSSFELVLIPQFQPTIIADINSIWYPKPPTMAMAVPPGFQLQRNSDYSKNNVDASVKNSEIAGKFSYLSGIIDFEIMGGYLWDDNPSLHTIKAIDPVNKIVKVTARPEYHRLTMGGGSFSTSIYGLVVRGEGAYYQGRNFMSLNPLAKEGVVEKNYMHYLMGLDYNILGVDVSAQYMEERILDYESNIYQDEVLQTATFLANQDFLNETLFISCLIYYGFNQEDALIRPKATYKYSDGLEVVLGANFLIGEGVGMFGQYSTNDMVYTKIKYSF
ncbi:MAG: DUF1302 family protein [Melioribacteraceae bacterium]